MKENMQYITSDMVIKVDEGFRALIPPLMDEELAKLTESIQESGIEVPVVLWESADPDQHNIIVDGMHRYQVAKTISKASGKEVPVPFVYKQFDGVQEVKLWMIRNQLGRRNLTTIQKADLGYEAKLAYSVITLARRNRGLAVLPGECKGDALDAAAQDVGVSQKTISFMENVHKAPEVYKLVKNNIVSLSTGSDLARLPEEKRAELLQHIDITANTQHNTKILKPKITAVVAQQAAEAEQEALNNQLAKVADSLVARFEKYYDRDIVRMVPKSYRLSKQEGFYATEADRKAYFLTLPNNIMEAVLRELFVRRQRLDRIAKGQVNSKGVVQSLTDDAALAVNDPLETPNPTYLVNAINVLFTAGYKITSATDVQREATKILEAESLQEYQNKMDALAKREATRLSKLEEELLLQSNKAAVAANVTFTQKALDAIAAMKDALDKHTMYCPVHGPTCQLTNPGAFVFKYECGLSLEEAATMAKENVDLLAPKLVQESKEVEGKGIQTSYVRTPGDVGKLYREQA
jgi:hypothetical protein